VEAIRDSQSQIPSRFQMPEAVWCSLKTFPVRQMLQHMFC